MDGTPPQKNKIMKQS